MGSISTRIVFKQGLRVRSGNPCLLQIFGGTSDEYESNLRNHFFSGSICQFQNLANLKIGNGKEVI